MTIQYVVLNENALGYINEEVQSGVIGVLAGKVTMGGPSPVDGPVCVSPSDKVRSAMAQDFDYFRVMLPPDFAA